MTKQIIFAITTIVIALLQISFLHEFPLLRYSLNFVLICVVLVTTISNYRNGFIFALLAGLILDLFSPFLYGTITFALVVPVVVIFVLFRKFLARKSAYSILGVIILSTIAYHAMLLLATTLIKLTDDSSLSFSLDGRYLLFVLTQLAVHSIVTLALFYSIRMLGNKFRSTFMISDRV